MLYINAWEMYLNYMNIVDRSKATKRGYREVLSDFQKFLEGKYNGPCYVEDIKQADIEGYLAHLKDERLLASASRSRSLYIIKAFISYLKDSEVVSKDPTRMIGSIKLAQKEREHMTASEVIELSEAIEQPVIKVMMMFLYYTGLRISEAIALTLEAVDLEEQIVHVINGKGNKNRNVPINDNAVKLLKDYLLNIRPKGTSRYFFSTKRTGSISPQYVNREIHLALLKLGWTKKISAHVLRHSYATALVEENVNIVYVSRLLGHSSLKTTGIYAHSKIEELRQAVKNL